MKRSTTGEVQPNVRAQDFVFVNSGSPEDLFEFFTSPQTLNLPVAWDYQSYGDFWSGAAYIGRTNLQFFRFDTDLVPRLPEGTARFHGIGFEAAGSLQDTLDYLKDQNIEWERGDINVGSTLLCTNIYPVNLDHPAQSDTGLRTQITFYGPDFYSATFRAATPSEYRDAADRELIDVRSGGPLGIQNAMTVVVESPDAPAAQSGFGRFLGIEPNSHGAFEFEDGPALKVIPGRTEKWAKLVLKVSDLDAAKDYLDGNNMLGIHSAEHVQIAPSAIQGLTIELRES
ncbi:hypothetical protein IL992_37330 [Microbispora sp. NEAU-D428]|uniref:hypothetical protein n=1 Tax=Microbispora sitophila TaxID=2771537 RepID=UPI0018670AA9|nr:hypothetical protein [Microbispora sitophila]MBE3014800.1 hypothetical protein [Microbispora sitophila]